MPINRRTIAFITIATFLVLLVSVANSQPKPAPQFELKTLDGRVVKLLDFRSKAVILNFWATWCAPCRVETPWLVELYHDYKGEGLEIVGISMDDGGPHLVEKFVHEMNVNYTV